MSDSELNDLVKEMEFSSPVRDERRVKEGDKRSKSAFRHKRSNPVTENQVVISDPSITKSNLLTIPDEDKIDTFFGVENEFESEED